MARETREQREEREIREQTERATAAAEFRKEIPAKMKALEQMAIPLQVHVEIGLLESGPKACFRSDDGHIHTDLTYDSEEWEFNSFEDQLRRRKEAQEAVAARKKMAQDHFSSLPQELREALKEHIHYCK